ncbi:ABC transporter substrate-binding protein [Shewanella sp. NIFS-20-20]|uniref:ABC transporter substrate-binding protein n=1 Tax=Shewanella sp. NIFS-20-20 TaxID=2853806 RepID=UPI001C446E42|nr:ABC transporter substrate-binding protein [Shewanella sp. NIFS-20-20]MBV7317240.1 ABC transporter substrate-binding protein [Shewanella sp. NIFS-20-20]
MRFIVLIFIMGIGGCSAPKPQKVTIAINPWPGYEVLYLAQELGYLQNDILTIELVEVMTLADSQRAYLSGNVDGFASTLVEAIQVEAFGGQPVQVLLLADYSNGGDVILAQPDIKSMVDLKGKLVGCEVSVLGIYILSRALAFNDMTLDDVEVVNVEQGDSYSMMQSGSINAMVTYAPFMTGTLSIPGVHRVFSSREIPMEILDVISMSRDVIDAQPTLVGTLREAWDKSLQFLEETPDVAIDIMAKRERVTSEEFLSSLAMIKLLSVAEQQQKLAQLDTLSAMGLDICERLINIGSITSSCQHVYQLFYQDGQ